MADLELDPRWDWVEVTALGDREPRYIKYRCKHLETIPISNVLTGDVMARLCLTCRRHFYTAWVDGPALPDHG